MSRRCFLIINPTAGSYSPALLHRVTEALRAGGVAPEVLPTAGPDDAAAFATRICAAEGDPLILAAGGDGTVNGVINGLEPGRATLGFIPLGTSNVLARELGIASVDDAVCRIVRGESRPLSVGLLEGFGLRRRFFLMAGAGFDGAVVEEVRGAEKRRFAQGAYLLAALRTFAAWDGRPMEVVAGGERRLCHSVVVCNASRYGGRFVLAPGASLFDSGFRVVCIEGARRIDYLRLALGVVAGRGATGRGVSAFTADEVEIGGNKPVQVDGDFLCHTPVRVSSLPRFARLMV